MVKPNETHDLSDQVVDRAARAGLWLTCAGVVLFVAGMVAGMALDRRLVGEQVDIDAAPPDEPATTVEKPEQATGPVHPKEGTIGRSEPAGHGLGDIKPIPSEVLDKVASRVRDVLRLSDEQERQVRQVIEKFHPRMEKLRHRIEPELRRLALDAVNDLLPILEPEQRDRLERILDRHAPWLGRAVSQPADAAADEDK